MILALIMEVRNQILLCAHIVQDLFKLSALFPEEHPTQDELTMLNSTVHVIYERFPS